jgi:hypothetical protein
MKSIIFFLIFFINTLIAIYFRYPLPLAFSVICLGISILFCFRPEDGVTVAKKQNSE